MINVEVVVGMPRFVRGDEASAYQYQISEFINGLGAKATVNTGLPDFNSEDLADLYVVHGKFVDQLPPVSESIPILRVGHPDGVIHPVDLDWQLKGSKGIPPIEHYVLTADQKLRIQEAVEYISKQVTPVAVVKPRQSASRRPGVR